MASGWATLFVIYSSIPGELDLPLLIEAAVDAATARRGIWASDEMLPAYEYRAVEKLYRVTKKIVEGAELRAGEAHSWRERYCVNMRTRTLAATLTRSGPYSLFGIGPGSSDSLAVENSPPDSGDHCIWCAYRKPAFRPEILAHPDLLVVTVRYRRH